MITEIEILFELCASSAKKSRRFQLQRALSQLPSGVTRQTGYLDVSTRRVESIGSNSDGMYTLSDRYTLRFRFQLP